MAFRLNRSTMGDDEIDYDEAILRQKGSDKKSPLWDSFQDPPPILASGSAASWNKFLKLQKVFKLFMYIFIFIVILVSCVVSKTTFLLMVSQLKGNNLTRFCDAENPRKELYAVIPEIQRIAWIWAIIFSFIIPEIFTFLRASRICFFQKRRVPTFVEVFLVMLMESLHVVGLALLAFYVFPAMSSANALMLTNCVCFIPGILSLVTDYNNHWKTILKLVVTALAIFAQMSGFFLWPILENKTQIHLLPVALIFVSFRWWENYLNAFPFNSKFNFLEKIRGNLMRSRHYIYLYTSPWKVCLLVLVAFVLDGRNISDYFSYFSDGWGEHDILIKERHPVYSDRPRNSTDYSKKIRSYPGVQIGILLVHITASFIAYTFAKIACKIKIQEFSFSLPLSIVVPITLVPVVVLSGLRESDACSLQEFLPNYLSFNGFPIHKTWDNIASEYLWIWLFWWLSQVWLTRHIWRPKNDKNAPTEKLFVAPWYSDFLIDQCILMNRRRFDQEDFGIFMESVTCSEPEISMSDVANDVQPSDKVPQLIVCATMWHENREEMMEFLKSILRLDEDQCARRIMRKYARGGKWDEEYYELETHIFFDDAFISDPRFCEDPRNPPINEYVQNLIDSIDKAAYKVYDARIHVKPPEKIITPYGGRLVWTLPGRTKMTAHLKSKSKIRNKKRWSQVMYMYYLLGYRIMEMKASPTRKNTIAENTFLLALDGDIDFQPQAVQLLIGRMKVDPDLGAACGRIHPVGKGAMVWFQVFEYAIGHWLQKATEHIIGCVLCSPGCFSLFRGRALMANSVMKKYTTVSQTARHAVQYDQGEDRWLCTLLLKQEFRVEYCAASDAYTHSPEEFNEFYNQRRRWIPSTIANILDLLEDAKTIVRNNNSISMPYIFYQGMLMLGTILGPGTIFLMMVGAFVAVFSVGILTSFAWNFVPVLIFMLICYYCQQKYQLLAAFVISSVYAMVMMAVLIGIIIQVMDDGILSPASLFFLAVVVQILVTGLLHPQEAGALICGIMYYITIPSMYMLLMIYSIFNMNDVSWGTRDKKPIPSDGQEHNYLPGWLDDPLLKDSTPGALSISEKKFWKNMIDRYLNPLNVTEEEEKKAREELKDLRDSSVFAFVMINSLFVLVVLLLQSKKDYLHIQWPFNAKNSISYDATTMEIVIYRTYLQLDPIGSLFVIFFGILLIVQFVAMIFHRFTTMSQIVAATTLDWFSKSNDNADDEVAVGKRIDFDNFETVKRFQRPKRCDEDVISEENEHTRRNTVHKILLIRDIDNPSDWSDLETNFKRRLKEMNKWDNLNISAKSRKFLENTRKSVFQPRNNGIYSNSQPNVNEYVNYGFVA